MTTKIIADTSRKAASMQHQNANGNVYDLTHVPLKDGKLSEAAQKDIETLILRAAAREHILTPKAFAAFLPRMQARLNALLKALDTDGLAAHTFGHRFDADYKSHVQEGNEHAMAMQDVQSIFLNRASDIKAALQLFAAPEFTGALASRLNTAAPALDTALTPQKLEEIKAALTADGKNGIDTPIHFKRNFLEHHKFHGALMDTFTSGSNVAQALEASLHTALPQDDAVNVKAFLDDWLALRAERARGVMEATRPDGELAQSAVREWVGSHGATTAQTPSTVIEKAAKIYKEIVSKVANGSASAERSA